MNIVQNIIVDIERENFTLCGIYVHGYCRDCLRGRSTMHGKGNVNSQHKSLRWEISMMIKI